MKREAEVLVQRKKEIGTVLYRVVDNPTKLSQPEWWVVCRRAGGCLGFSGSVSGIVWWLYMFRVQHGSSKVGHG